MNTQKGYERKRRERDRIMWDESCSREWNPSRIYMNVYQMGLIPFRIKCKLLRKPSRSGPSMLLYTDQNFYTQTHKQLTTFPLFLLFTCTDPVVEITWRLASYSDAERLGTYLLYYTLHNEILQPHSFPSIHPFTYLSYQNVHSLCNRISPTLSSSSFFFSSRITISSL